MNQNAIATTNQDESTALQIDLDDVFGVPHDQAPAAEDPEPESAGSGESDEPDFDSEPAQSGPNLANQKAKLISDLVDHLGKLYPEDNPEGQAARLKILKETFGKTVLDDIGKMPLQIIEAGVKMIAEKVIETEGKSE